jgi:hypothetical protein
MATRKTKSKTKKTAEDDAPVSAQVILRPKGGIALNAASVTAANIREILPEPEKVENVSRWFANKGFDVGAAYGTSFSITAPKSTFERVFETELDKHDSLALPLEPLSNDVAEEVEEVTFTPPPDFGPTSY